MNDKEKDAIYLEVADFFDQHIGKEKRMHDSLGTCLYWARVGALVLAHI